MGEHQSFELFPSQQSCSYRVRFQDIGRCLKCECTIIDIFGRSSETVSAVTSPILPGYLFVLQGNDKCMIFLEVPLIFDVEGLAIISLFNFMRHFFCF